MSRRVSAAHAGSARLLRLETASPLGLPRRESLWGFIFPEAPQRAADNPAESPHPANSLESRCGTYDDQGGLSGRALVLGCTIVPSING